jgi:hypothetical protein
LDKSERIILPSLAKAHPGSTHPAGAGLGGPPEPSRALVPIAPARPYPDRTATHRPSAGFLAHLIATAQQMPQTRMRRRAEPAHASALYAAASGAVRGGKLRRLA